MGCPPPSPPGRGCRASAAAGEGRDAHERRPECSPRPSQFGDDRFQHFVHALEDVVVPDAEHSITRALHPLRSLPVLSRLLMMLTAVKLDNEPFRHAGEVRDVRSDRNLPAELVSAQASIAHAIPQQSLCVRRGATEGTGSSRGVHEWNCSRPPLTPGPSPGGRGEMDNTPSRGRREMGNTPSRGRGEPDMERPSPWPLPGGEGKRGVPHPLPVGEGAAIAPGEGCLPITISPGGAGATWTARRWSRGRGAGTRFLPPQERRTGGRSRCRGRAAP